MRPNVILITTDQHRFDALGCMGNPLIRTPNFNRLAASGLLYRRAYSPCPLCVPARAVLLTGLAAGRLESGRPGSIDNGTLVDADVRTVPTLFNEAGYHTEAIGKMHLLPMGDPRGFTRQTLSEETRFYRFAQRGGRRRTHSERGRSAKRSNKPGSPSEPGKDDYDRYLDERGLLGYDKPPEIGYNEIKPLVSPLKDEDHVTTWCADRTIEFLRNRPKAGTPDADTPFFLWTSFVKPHVPYDPPQPWHRMYDPDELPPRIVPRAGDNPMYEHHVKHAEWDMYSEKSWKLAKAYYYGVVSHIDHHLGRVLDELDAQGMWDDTMVVFTADHGDFLGDHGMWYKSLPHESSMHVPLMVKPPGSNHRPETRDDLADLHDVTATLLAAAGIDAPEMAPGVDLLAGRNQRDGLACELGGGAGRWAAWVDERYKFWHFIEGGYEELYDLHADPDETRNLIDTPDGKRVRAELVPKLVAWIREYANPEHVIDEGGELRTRPQKLHELHAPGTAEGPFSRGIGAWPRVPEAYQEE